MRLLRSPNSWARGHDLVCSAMLAAMCQLKAGAVPAWIGPRQVGRLIRPSPEGARRAIDSQHAQAWLSVGSSREGNKGPVMKFLFVPPLTPLAWCQRSMVLADRAKIESRRCWCPDPVSSLRDSEAIRRARRTMECSSCRRRQLMKHIRTRCHRNVASFPYR